METVELDGVRVLMDGSCLGVMGPKGGRTVVRPTADGRYAVMTAAAPYRLIKVLRGLDGARVYNAAIHGERL